jgi:thioredoxin reductase
MPDYDAIVIGSGSGGLTAAVAIANTGTRRDQIGACRREEPAPRRNLAELTSVESS